MKERRGVRLAIGRLLLFQLKLFADAGRDFLLSPISTVALLLDLVLGLDGEDSYYERLMAFGVRSDHFINLFGQYPQGQTIDSVVKDVTDGSNRND
ncbi:MAG: hypothetical protein AB8B48_13265 [Pseudomonadales bacterium]